jgi:hypothetical protein
MAHFLLVYDRDAGRLISKQQYAVGADALRARFAAERDFAGHAGIEIVALSAESEDELLVTHGRYFLGLTELADRMG